MATDELANKLNRRINISDAIEAGDTPPPCANKVFNPYTEFKEFSRKQIKDLEKTFKKWVSVFTFLPFLTFSFYSHLKKKICIFFKEVFLLFIFPYNHWKIIN